MRRRTVQPEIRSFVSVLRSPVTPFDKSTNEERELFRRAQRFWQQKVWTQRPSRGEKLRCILLARKSAKLFVNFSVLATKGAKFLANFSAPKVTSLPSHSLSLSLYHSLSHQAHLTHNIGSASALPIIKTDYYLSRAAALARLSSRKQSSSGSVDLHGAHFRGWNKYPRTYPAKMSTMMVHKFAREFVRRWRLREGERIRCHTGTRGKIELIRSPSEIIELLDSFSLLKLLFLVRNWHCWSLKLKAFPRQMRPQSRETSVKSAVDK